jgi:hypothetical protein
MEARRKVYFNKLQAQINKKFRELRSKRTNERLAEFEKLRKHIAESLIPSWQLLLSEDEKE